VWGLANLAWIKISGHDMPFVAFIAVLIIKSMNRKRMDSSLTDNARRTFDAEIVAIAVLMIAVLIFSRPVIWY
jgi:hypothetical protein